MPEYLHPGVYVEEIPSGAGPIEGVSTSTACLIGEALEGRPNHPTLVTSWPEFERRFGGLDPIAKSHLPPAVQQFFLNGGARACIVRLMASDAGIATSGKEDPVRLEARGRGVWGNVKVTLLRSVVVPDRIDLQVETVSGGQMHVVEVFSGLGLTSVDEKFYASIINRDSDFVKVAPNASGGHDDLDSGKLDLKKGAAGTELASREHRAIQLTGGDDGTGPAITAQTLGDALSSLDRVDDVSLLAAPGVTVSEPTLSGKLVDYAAARPREDLFVILDGPGDSGNTNAGGLVERVQEELAAFPTQTTFAALYFPWLEVPDPYTSVAGATRYSPPSGAIAGLFARTDNARGVWKAPAGTEASVLGAVGLAVNVTDAEQDPLNPVGINCIRQFDASGIVCWGARTLGSLANPEFRYVPIRRLAMFLRESLFRGTRWAVFEPNDEPLWEAIRFNVDAFMMQQFRSGAFQGASPTDAYFVQCDATNNIQATIDAGQVHIRVGFAPFKPAEFVIIELVQIAQAS